MTTAHTEMSFEQWLAAIRKLPYAQKTKLWQTLDAELNRADARRQAREEFAEAVRAIRTANKGVTEDEVVADVSAAVKEVRAVRVLRRVNFVQVYKLVSKWFLVNRISSYLE